MKHLGVIYGGAYYHHRALNHPKYRHFFHECIYLLDLPQTNLSALDGLLVPERLHRDRLLACRAKLEKFLEGGKVIVSFGEQPEPLFAGVHWEYRPTNFWWWKEPRASSGLSLAQPDHSLFRHITLSDTT